MRSLVCFWTLVLLATPELQADDATLRQQALATLKQSTTYYRNNVASQGGYVYYYSLDLKERWGEGKASPDTIFVQPPGTPSVGMAYLKAYSATGDTSYLVAARETAQALVRGQLQSGGWDQTIHFAKPERGRFGKYRKGGGGNWNTSSLDDSQTQSALTFLIRVDEATRFGDASIHEAATYGLNALLQAQFANGGFPQVWSGPVAPKPVVRARYPEHDWKTEGRVKNYWDHYTLNDNLVGTVADVLIEANRVYQEKKYRQAIEKLGDFLILAQMPAPQPGWCQQYNDAMEPMWARKFEPPAITGWESQDAMRTLIKIYRVTGDKKYLEPIPPALAYFEKCLLPDGSVARYYELKSNKPLYMDAKYQLTYDDSAAPDHYGWKQPARFRDIEKEMNDARAGVAPPPADRKAIASRAQKAIKELDAEGRWVSTYNGERLTGQPKFATSFRYLSSEVFCRNVESLCDLIAATK